MTRAISDDQNAFVNAIAIIIAVIICIIYFVVLGRQQGYLKEGTVRLQTLAMRAGFVFPCYSVLMMISLLKPNSYAGLQILVAFLEGYAFYCFWALVVENLGGPEETVKKLVTQQSLGHGFLCCSCCCPTDRRNFYTRGLWSQWHFVVTRTIIVTIATICDYSGSKKLFFVFNVIAFFVLVNGIMTLIDLYENVMSDCANLKALLKASLVKVSTGLMVVQGIITEAFISLNKVTIADSNEFTADQEAIRIYCFVLLVEYLFLSILFWFAFSPEILPPTRPGTSDDARDKALFNPVHKSYCGFFMDVLRIQDVFNTLNLDNSQGQSLVQSSGSNNI